MQNESSKISRKTLIITIAALVLIIATIIVQELTDDRHYYISSVLIIIFIMVPFFVSYEGKKPKATDLVTLAIMCAIAVASRAAFVWAPNFKPIAGIIIITAMAFGPISGFICGALSLLCSDFIFGMGMWVPWQMIAFGTVGFLAGLLAKANIMRGDKILRSAIISFFLYLAVCGPILDICSISLMPGNDNWSRALAIFASGFVVNLEQSITTFATVLILGKPILGQLERLKVKYGILTNEIK